MSPERALLLVLGVVTGGALFDASFGGWRSVSWLTVLGLAVLGVLLVLFSGLRKSQARTDDRRG